MIEELKEELAYGALKLTDTIQVLRDADGYIEDWYYDAAIMAEITRLDFDDSEDERIEKEEIKASYFEDKPQLESMLAGKVLLEME
jgi:hypothetical protein